MKNLESNIGSKIMKQNRMKVNSGLIKQLAIVWIGFFAAMLSGCEAPDDVDESVINQLALPTDVVLNLACADVGINTENCVLADPENPFVTITITEFNEAEPDAPFNKFELAAAIPPGPSGAKARFYFWATALARRPSGVNQYYTALALHELFDANSNQLSQDNLVRAQALKAYRSVLDNYFNSVVVFTCCAASSSDGEEIAFPVSLKLLTADSIHRTARTGYRRLVDGDPLESIEQLLNWGYRYSPIADDSTTPDVDETLQGVVEIIQ